MTDPQGYRRISVDTTRAAEVLHVDSLAFAFTVNDADKGFMEKIMPWDRARAMEVADATRGTVGSLAAVHASFAFQMRVPGGSTVATSGLSWVGVHPGHRRRGLLSAMMADHFERSLSRGEPISILHAAETEIYQRFGYGLAAYDVRAELSRGVKLRPIDGADALNVTIDSADYDQHAEVIAAVQTQHGRPGTFAEYPESLARDLFMDLEADRHGAEQLRFATVWDGETPVAWALFQRKGDWTDASPNGKNLVKVWAALDAKSSHRLWSVLSDLDLMTSTYVENVAIDDPLVHQVRDMRGAKLVVRDNVWVRLLDLPAALQARGYAADCDVTVAVEDAHLPANAGTWRIQVTDGAATVSPTDGPADLETTTQWLAAAYLGGVSISEQTRAGLITEHTPGSATALSRAMVSDVAPLSNLPF